MIEDFNTILLWFNNNPGMHVLTKEHFRGITDDFSIIEQLVDYKLLLKKEISSRRFVYAISQDGVDLINHLPEKYNGNPYGFFIKSQQNSMISENTLLKYFYKKKTEITLDELLEKYETNAPNILTPINQLKNDDWLKENSPYSWIITDEGIAEQESRNTIKGSEVKTPKETFTEKEKQDVFSKIDAALKRFDKLDAGQQLIFEEIEELREYIGKMNKKTWTQLLKGKLLDLVTGNVLNATTAVYVFDTITETIKAGQFMLPR